MNISYKELKLIKERLSYNHSTGIFIYSKYFSGMQPGTVAGTARPDGYLGIRVNGRFYHLHRLAIIWDLNEEELDNIPDDLEVDHINNRRADNKRSNLRLATRSQNFYNSSIYKNNTTGVKGVTLTQRGTYIASITTNKKRIKKSFITIEEAKEFSCSLRLNLHGEFANHG